MVDIAKASAHTNSSSQAAPAGQLSALLTQEESLTHMTPDTILFFCQSRLRTLDTAIAEKLNQQRQLTNHSVLDAVKAAVTKCTENNLNKEGNYEITQANYESVVANIDAALADPTLSKENRKKLEGARDAFMNGGLDVTFPDNTKGAGVSKDQLKAISETCDDALKAKSSEAELNMISIQSLMSQRQTAVQLTTNMMAAINDSLKAIAANTKG